MKYVVMAQIIATVVVLAGLMIYLQGATWWGNVVAIAGGLMFMVATVMSTMKSGEP